MRYLSHTPRLGPTPCYIVNTPIVSMISFRFPFLRGSWGGLNQLNCVHRNPISHPRQAEPRLVLRLLRYTAGGPRGSLGVKGGQPLVPGSEIQKTVLGVSQGKSRPPWCRLLPLSHLEKPSNGGFLGVAFICKGVFKYWSSCKMGRFKLLLKGLLPHPAAHFGGPSNSRLWTSKTNKVGGWFWQEADLPAFERESRHRIPKRFDGILKSNQKPNYPMPNPTTTDFPFGPTCNLTPSPVSLICKTTPSSPSLVLCPP